MSQMVDPMEAVGDVGEALLRQSEFRCPQFRDSGWAESRGVMGWGLAF